MIEKTLNINEVDATRNPILYTCHGLGSCIGLFLTDRLKSLVGGAHISWSPSLPNQGNSVVNLISKLLAAFQSQGSDLMNLKAKLAGGAKVYDSSFNVGEENTNAVVEYLIQQKIFIAASDVGGHLARTVQFNGVTGELKISTSEKTYYI